MYLLFLLQLAVPSPTGNPPSPWWETPTGAAAVVALIGVLTAPFINSWIQSRRAKRDIESHLSDTSLTVSAQERKDIIEQMRTNHAAQVNFMKEQLREISKKTSRQTIENKVSEYDARQRMHAYGNECYRLQTQVSKLQLLLAQNDVTVPDFIFKAYPDIMMGIDQLVTDYKRELEIEAEREREKEDEEDE